LFIRGYYYQSLAVLDMRTARGQTALHMAAATGNIKEVELLLLAGASPFCFAYIALHKH
jgi:ankyrin repeat protein